MLESHTISYLDPSGSPPALTARPWARELVEAPPACLDQGEPLGHGRAVVGAMQPADPGPAEVHLDPPCFGLDCPPSVGDPPASLVHLGLKWPITFTRFRPTALPPSGP